MPSSKEFRNEIEILSCAEDYHYFIMVIHPSTLEKAWLTVKSHLDVPQNWLTPKHLPHMLPLPNRASGDSAFGSVLWVQTYPGAFSRSALWGPNKHSLPLSEVLSKA
jgi:hypothetical protein